MKEIRRMTDQINKNVDRIELTAEIVSAYVSNNSVPAGDLASLIEDVYKSLASLARLTEAPAIPLTPIMPIKRTIQDNYIVCLEDGKKFKSLKRHLMSSHGLTPNEYRAKWGLPFDYPMTAPAYSMARSALAKKLGLGRKPTVQPEPVTATVKRGRKLKAA